MAHSLLPNIGRQYLIANLILVYPVQKIYLEKIKKFGLISLVDYLYLEFRHLLLNLGYKLVVMLVLLHQGDC